VKRFALSVCVMFVVVLALSCCTNNGGLSTDEYVAEFTSADEDYVDFGTLEGFTATGDWSVIEKVKLPADFTQVGWHVFRGKGWEDQYGDLAISLKSDRVHAWFYQGSMLWDSVQYAFTVQLDRWYTICFQYDASSETLELYVDGSPVDSLSGVTQKDDSANTNKLFFGGQDVDPVRSEGDLYSEADIVIAHQAWLQRTLTPTEIAQYDGSFDTSDPDLFFATEITESGILDESGGGRDGTNGNSPEFYLESF